MARSSTTITWDVVFTKPSETLAVDQTEWLTLGERSQALCCRIMLEVAVTSAAVLCVLLSMFRSSSLTSTCTASICKLKLLPRFQDTSITQIWNGKGRAENHKMMRLSRCRPTRNRAFFGGGNLELKSLKHAFFSKQIPGSGNCTKDTNKRQGMIRRLLALHENRCGSFSVCSLLPS